MNNRILVGTHKGLFRIERSDAGKWSISDQWFLGDPVSMVLSEPGQNRIHVALDLGHFGVKMKRSTDDGATWNEVAMPAYPLKPEGVEDIDPMRGTDIPWDTKLVWSLESGGENQLWCGTLPGGLFHSTDGGDSWNLIRSLWDDPRRKQWMGGGYDLAGIHSILVDPRDSAHITVGVSVGGVWSSRDSGEHWELIGKGLRNAYMPPDKAGDPVSQDVHKMVACPRNPDRVWMQHHNGIFISDDGGAYWRELLDVQPSCFGFAVVVHPTDPDSAWFVPAVKDEQRIPVDAHLIVNRTRDGGKSFECLDKGLPEEPSYDLVYRHSLDIANDGERLTFGSTTGSLWVSENQGDSWQNVSKHLPPIKCVRFEN